MRLPIGMRRGKSKDFSLPRTGFTLIELILVIFLILTILGLSIPLFKKTFFDLSAKDASLTVSKLINYAQEMSVLGRKSYKITFDAKNGKYQLFEVDLSATPPVYKRASGRFGRAFNMPQGVSYSASKKEMVFYPDGHCDAVKLKVMSKGGGYFVEVKNFGNMVEIKEADSE